MGAKAKLNSANTIGVLGIAIVAGGLTGSLGVFVITFALLFGLACANGNVRA